MTNKEKVEQDILAVKAAIRQLKASRRRTCRAEG